MKSIGLIGFILIVAGAFGYGLSLFLFERYNSPGFLIAKVIIGGGQYAALVFFYLQAVRGGGAKVVPAAGIAAVLVGAAWVVYTGFNILNFMDGAGMPFAEALKRYFLWNQFWGVQAVLRALALVLLLYSIHRAGRIVMNVPNVVLAAMVAVLTLVQAARGLDSGLEVAGRMAQHYQQSLILCQAEYWLGPLGSLGFVLFWGSLAIAQRRHWLGGGRARL